MSTPIYDAAAKPVTTDEHGGPTSTPQPKVLAEEMAEFHKWYAQVAYKVVE